MTDTGPGDGATASTSALRERWREQSVGSVWLRASDWYHPAVDDVIGVVIAQQDAEAATGRLGAARGGAGVGISETIDDLACLYRLVGRGDPPVPVVRSLCEAWSDAQSGGTAPGGCVDPTSGLPTRDYLATRLRETYGLSARTATPVPDTHVLLLVDASAAEQSPWARAARAAATGAALRDAFDDGHPVASIGADVFAVLVPRAELDDAPHRADDVLALTLAHVARTARRLEVADLLQHPPRARWVRLPVEHEDAVQLLVDLAR
ncbi:hypothetical protein ACGIF2_10010 [Cellulomonas sp. P22]|uniref:hypothetical protein n=1 Tax=Cellulomonas sp. P22 TaxID=3373189 RepID=UPI00378814E4